MKLQKYDFLCVRKYYTDDNGYYNSLILDSNKKSN